MLLRPRATQPRPPRQLPRVRLVVRPLLLVTPGDRIQMSETEVISKVSPGTTLPVVNAPEMAVLVVQLVIAHEHRVPLLSEALPEELHRDLVDVILGRFLLILRTFGRELFWTRRGGAGLCRVEDVSGETAFVATTFLIYFCARQSAAPNLSQVDGTLLGICRWDLLIKRSCLKSLFCICFYVACCGKLGLESSTFNIDFRLVILYGNILSTSKMSTHVPIFKKQ